MKEETKEIRRLKVSILNSHAEDTNTHEVNLLD